MPYQGVRVLNLFVLGSSLGVSYLGDGYATITDWNPSADFMQARGNSSQYSLVSGNFGVGSSATDLGNLLHRQW